ncbi:MAG: trypsin-like peptidase domain-containing protein [Microthrixaceae bacterium]|nr:trypsin-like peptidase domain-containing protein [Microthrixaceae bacterium]
MTDAPEPKSTVLGGINGSLLEHEYGKGVAMILTRDCHGGLATGSGFAIDKRKIVTNWHVVADDNSDPDSTIDPRPWILTYDRGWRRGSVLGSTPSPDTAVIQLDPDEPDMNQTLEWADDEVKDGDFVASMGYPGLERLEFQLTVAKVTDSHTTNASAEGAEPVPSFKMDKVLSARTGPGNSGGPIVKADGRVVGVLTWGRFDLRTWFGSDGPEVRSAVNAIDKSPERASVACDADSKQRFPLTYVVKLGTFPNVDEYMERLEVVEDAGPDGAQVIWANTANSDEWDGFLLSNYPYVMLAGPFDSREKAYEARDLYQHAVDNAGQKDKFSVGVVPRLQFAESQAETNDAPKQCAEFRKGTVQVAGVTPSDPLKFRDQPTTKGSVLDNLYNEEVLQLTTDDPVEADGFTWIRVAPAKDNGTICGWVAKKYTTA